MDQRISLITLRVVGEIVPPIGTPQLGSVDRGTPLAPFRDLRGYGGEVHFELVMVEGWA